jgi:hypothetical protein
LLTKLVLWSHVLVDSVAVAVETVAVVLAAAVDSVVAVVAIAVVTVVETVGNPNF